ncbi:hypothetical protein H0H87_007268 [Tephrocybe sp. NHM501043]|nr:hypothetical protein H0H87_007268 [Tephrocybe sp. NHM501043]
MTSEPATVNGFNDDKAAVVFLLDYLDQKAYGTPSTLPPRAPDGLAEAVSVLGDYFVSEAVVEEAGRQTEDVRLAKADMWKRMLLTLTRLNLVTSGDGAGELDIPHLLRLSGDSE